MELQLNNRAFLREHPDLPPWVDGSYAKNHSFIMPGDELVLYHGINLPGDAGVSSMNDISLKSIKVSIVAEKSNPFSSAFSKQFKSVRRFELDSFTMGLNNNNTPVIPWCSDGYAPNLNFQTDRNWKLPSGDFKRQLNLFTQHNSGSPTWTYWAYFPILFRWEYWQQLATADNDFINACNSNNGTVQNNQNKNWLNYHVPPTWCIKSRCELTLLVNGQLTTLVSELNLSRLQASISNYGQNSDYTECVIQSCPVGGVPASEPCLINGDQNTSIFATFNKTSEWSYREQANISGFIWIEIFQGGGASQRMRASSSFKAATDSCFINLQYPVLNDQGQPVLNDNGDQVLHDPAGVQLSFNGQTIRMEAQLDVNKFLAAFPNATSYNIGAKLYNKTVYTD